jgi:hypothetical protein
MNKTTSTPMARWVASEESVCAFEASRIAINAAGKNARLLKSVEKN